MSDPITTVLQPPAVIQTTLATGQGPAGVGASPALLTATEALVAGDFVNVFSGGVRKASNDHVSRECCGFITHDAAIGAEAAIDFAGINFFVSGLTVGPVWLGLNGACSNTPPSAPAIVQPVGYATSATSVNFLPGMVVVLAGTQP